MVQPVPPSYMAYDRTIVVFSPDGRLLQVEYARQAVKKGNTSLGIKTRDFVVLGAIRSVPVLGAAESHKKVFEVDDHAGMASSGLLADARDLVDYARVKAQVNKITFDEPISISTLTKHVADRKHLVTQYAGVRPFGVGFLIGGINGTGTQLFETDPSGTVIEWMAQAIGRGADKAKKVLEKGYSYEMNLSDALKLAVNVLKTTEKADVKNMEIVVIDKKGFKLLSSEELSKV